MGNGNGLKLKKWRQRIPVLRPGDHLHYSPPAPPGGHPHYSPTLQFSDHLYHLYSEATGQLPFLAQFISSGLEVGQQCVHVADDLPEEAVVEALEATGIDTIAEKQDGALQILSKWQWRDQEHLDPAQMVLRLASLVSQGHRAGYSGTRVWVEMTWALNPAVDPILLEAWETLVHWVIQGEPVLLVCSYNLRRLPQALIKVGENTHPLRTAGDQILPNDQSRLPALYGKHATTLRCFERQSQPRLVDTLQ